MCIELYRLKTKVIKGVHYTDINNPQAVIDFLGDAFLPESSKDSVIHFKDNFGVIKVVFFHEVVLKIPVIGFTVMSSKLLDSMYERLGPAPVLNIVKPTEHLNI